MSDCFHKSPSRMNKKTFSGPYGNPDIFLLIFLFLCKLLTKLKNNAVLFYAIFSYVSSCSHFCFVKLKPQTCEHHVKEGGKMLNSNILVHFLGSVTTERVCFRYSIYEMILGNILALGRRLSAKDTAYKKL